MNKIPFGTEAARQFFQFKTEEPGGNLAWTPKDLVPVFMLDSPPVEFQAQLAWHQRYIGTTNQNTFLGHPPRRLHIVRGISLQGFIRAIMQPLEADSRLPAVVWDAMAGWTLLELGKSKFRLNGESVPAGEFFKRLGNAPQ